MSLYKQKYIKLMRLKFAQVNYTVLYSKNVCYPWASLSVWDFWITVLHMFPNWNKSN